MIKSITRNVEDGHIYKFLAGLNVKFDEVRGRMPGKKLVHLLMTFFLKFAGKEVARML